MLVAAVSYAGSGRVDATGLAVALSFSVDRCESRVGVCWGVSR